MTTSNQIIGVDAVRANLIQPKKIQLHSGMQGFDSPDAYGIYRHTGGKPLGVVGSVYEPPDLDLLLDTILTSVDSCADYLDIDKIEYSEFKGGSKIRISIPGPTIEVKSKVVGDLIGIRIDFMAGFDGLTKTSGAAFGTRYTCTNGARMTKKDLDFAFKNTRGNKPMMALFCDKIIQIMAEVRNYNEFLNKAAQITFSKADKELFLNKLLGYGEQEYKELTTRKRNILDKINASTAIEERELGNTLYTLLQGVTRYTTHELAGGEMDKLLTDNPMAMNQKAHELVYAMSN